MKDIKAYPPLLVVLYIRVSTEEQKENGYSLQEQNIRITKFCEKSNWEIIERYEDDHSAKDFERPQFKILLEAIKKRKIRPDAIVVTKIDRFSRHSYLAQEMVETLSRYGVKVFSIADNQFYDFKDPNSFFQQYFSIGIAQYENIVRSDNTKRGMRQAAKEGRTMGKAPVGYCNNKYEKTIDIHPVNGPLIKKGFEMLSQGVFSIEEVRKKLLKQGLKKCCKQTFLNIVRSKYYYGVIIVKEWADEPVQEVIGQHPPLISKELFDEVQMVLFGTRKKLSVVITRKEELPLRGYLYCHSCQGKLTGSASTSRNGDKHFYYHCQKGCKERFRADLANDCFENYIGSFQTSENVLKLYRLILEDVFNQDENDRLVLVKQVQSKIEQIKTKLESLQDKLLENVIDKIDYHLMKPRILAELNDWILKKEDLSRDISGFQTYLDYGLLFLFNMKEYYQSATLEVKQKIIGSIFPEKIIFFENKYRTTKTNELLSLLTLNINELGGVKKQKATLSNGLSNYAPPLGLEPRTL